MLVEDENKYLDIAFDLCSGWGRVNYEHICRI